MGPDRYNSVDSSTLFELDNKSNFLTFFIRDSFSTERENLGFTYLVHWRKSKLKKRFHILFFQSSGGCQEFWTEVWTSKPEKVALNPKNQSTQNPHWYFKSLRNKSLTICCSIQKPLKYKNNFNNRQIHIRISKNWSSLNVWFKLLDEFRSVQFYSIRKLQQIWSFLKL